MASIFHQLTEKPWLIIDQAAPEDMLRDPEPPSAAPTGLKVYFAVAAVMFTLLTAAYVMRMGVLHIGEGLDWKSTPKPWLLWVNTGILLLSSFVFQGARRVAQEGKREQLSSLLLMAGFLSFAFLAGQLTVWREFINEGYFASTNPAYAFFYLMTTLHGLHLLGGLVAWTRTMNKVWSGVDMTKVALSVRLCAIYWHFLLVVWVAMFYLLLAT